MELKRITNELLDTDTDNLPGDLPGVILTKTRSAEVNSNILFMGISNKGIDFPGIDGKTYLLFVLISPKKSTTQRNLNILTNLARILGSRKTVKKLKAAKSMKEIDEVFQKAQLN